MACNVLVVEDSPSFGRALAELVRSEGHGVIIAMTVAEAVEKIGERPSHVILDLNLPDGTGIEVLERIRREKLPAKVAVLSGTTDDELWGHAGAMEPDVMLRKPIDWNQLMAWLSSGDGQKDV